MVWAYVGWSTVWTGPRFRLEGLAWVGLEGIKGVLELERGRDGFTRSWIWLKLELLLRD